MLFLVERHEGLKFRFSGFGKSQLFSDQANSIEMVLIDDEVVFPPSLVIDCRLFS